MTRTFGRSCRAQPAASSRAASAAQRSGPPLVGRFDLRGCSRGPPVLFSYVISRWAVLPFSARLEQLSNGVPPPYLQKRGPIHGHLVTGHLVTPSLARPGGCGLPGSHRV